MNKISATLYLNIQYIAKKSDKKSDKSVATYQLKTYLAHFHYWEDLFVMAWFSFWRPTVN